MQRNHGIDVNGEKICALLYADDLLIIGQSAEQLQDLLDSMCGWCRKWKLLINVSTDGDCEIGRIWLFLTCVRPSNDSTWRIAHSITSSLVVDGMWCLNPIKINGNYTFMKLTTWLVFPRVLYVMM